MQPLSGLSVVVKKFNFVGNTRLSAEQLRGVLSSYVNRPVDFAQLQAAVATLGQAYREAGWIARAYLPAQEIKDGLVTIAIVEAVFGGAVIDVDKATRVKASQILSMIDHQQAAGGLLNNDSLDRALLLANDLSGITVEGSLREGKNPAETALALQLGDKPGFSGTVNLDNQGSRSTGAQRLSADLQLASPLGFGDQIASSAVHTSGSDYLSLAYSAPLGLDGWRMGINTSHLDYQLVGAEFEGLNAKGSSDSSGLEATYPLLRSKLKNLYLNLKYDWKKFDNQSGGDTTTHYGLDALTIALNGNYFDSWQGGGASAASLSYVNGTVNLDGSPNQEGDASTAQTQGGFSKLRWNLSRQQTISEELSLFGQWMAQIAGKNLDSSEKLYLGGASGVRAYPSGEGGGSEGHLLNLELRWRLAHGFTLTGFYDYGQVVVNRYNNYANSVVANAFSLKGRGLALIWNSMAGEIKAVWSQRDGSNPNPSATGSDQDGTQVRDRLWVSANMPF